MSALLSALLLGPAAALSIHDKYTPEVSTVTQGDRRSSTEFRIRAQTLLNDDEDYFCTSGGQVVEIGESSGAACSDTVVTDCDYTCSDEEAYGRRGSERAEYNSALKDYVSDIVNNITLYIELGDGQIPSAGLQIPSEGSCGFYQGIEYDDADLLQRSDLTIYFTTRPAPEPDALSYGMACVVAENGRPVLGHVNIDGGFFKNNFNLEDPRSSSPQLYNLLLREIMHVLGFSTKVAPALFDVTEYVGAAALAEARTYFGCPTLSGIEMEEFVNHNSLWEKRILNGDIMTGDVDDDSVLSTISFSALTDVGFYTVDVAQAAADGFLGTLSWAAGQGCSYITGSCLDWTNACDVDASPVCDTDGRGRTCDLVAYDDDLPAAFQYFDGLPTLGGADPLLDYCPLVSDGSRTCQTPVSDATADFFAGYSEQVFSDARCFSSDLAETGATLPFSGAIGACYRARCVASDSMYVAVGNAWQVCTSGGTLEADGFEGSVACPADLTDSAWCGAADVRPWPVVDSVDPASAIAAGNTLLTILGSDFPAEAVVTINGEDCNPSLYLSSSKLICVTPELEEGVVAINVLDVNSYAIVSLDAAVTVVADQEELDVNFVLYDPLVDEQFDLAGAAAQALINGFTWLWPGLEEANEAETFMFFFALFAFFFFCFFFLITMCFGKPIPKRELKALRWGPSKLIATVQFYVQIRSQRKKRRRKADAVVRALQK